MLFVVIFTIACIIYIINDIVPIFQKKEWKLFWTYIVVMGFAYVLAVMIAFGIKIPSPAGPLKMIVTMIFRI